MAGSSPPASSPAVRRSMQGNRSRDTAPERMLRSALHRRGLRFRKHVRPVPGERFTVDACFPTERVAVLVHGCFWHRCPLHCKPPRAHAEWWAEKLGRNVRRDALVVDRLLAEGWLPVVLWEHVVRADPEACAGFVGLVVRARRADTLREDGREQHAEPGPEVAAAP